MGRKGLKACVVVNGLGWLERLGWERCKKPVRRVRGGTFYAREARSEKGERGERVTYIPILKTVKRGRGRGKG